MYLCVYVSAHTCNLYFFKITLIIFSSALCIHLLNPTVWFLVVFMSTSTYFQYYKMIHMYMTRVTATQTSIPPPGLLVMGSFPHWGRIEKLTWITRSIDPTLGAWIPRSIQPTLDTWIPRSIQPTLDPWIPRSIEPMLDPWIPRSPSLLWVPGFPSQPSLLWVSGFPSQPSLSWILERFRELKVEGIVLTTSLIVGC